MRLLTSPGATWPPRPTRSFSGSEQRSAARQDWRCREEVRPGSGAVASVARAEYLERLGVAGGRPDEVLGPLPHVRVAGLGHDAIACPVEVELGDPEIGSWPKHRPVRARPAIRHSDAARVDHEPPVREPGKRHVS